MEKNNEGVHATHCCTQHGCKYGDDDCPVVAGRVAQAYPCEECENGVPQQLSLDAFMAKTRAEFDRFETYWRKMHATQPDTFPASMWEGDWHEQFRSFADSER